MNILRRSLFATLAAFAFCLCAPSLAGQEPERDRAQFLALIEELKTLSEKPTREEFLKRKAMSELFVNGSKSYPILKEVFLTSDHWAIKASTGFLLVNLINGTDRETGSRMRTLLEDAHPVVRVLAATHLNHSESGVSARAAEILSRKEESAIAERLKISWFDTRWLSDEDWARWFAANLAIVESGTPLTDPPEFESARLRFRGESESPVTVTGAAFWKLKPTSDLAMVGLVNAISQSGHAHEEAILKSLETDDGVDPGRLGLKFRLAWAFLNHCDKSCRNTLGPTPCERLGPFMNRALPICEKWIRGSEHRWVLNQCLRVLDGMSAWGSKEATQLLERVAKDHADEQVRNLARFKLNARTNR